MTKYAIRVPIFVACLVLCVECGDDSTSRGKGPSGGSGGTSGTNGGSGEGGQSDAAGAGGVSSEDLRGPCTAFCQAVAGAMCPNDVTSTECVDGCIFTGTFAAECASLFEPWLSCATNASLACNAYGEAETASCDEQEATFTDCLEGI